MYFLQEFFERTFNRLTIAVTALVGFLFVIVGPFGTFTLFSFLERIGFWVPLTVLALVLGGFCTVVIDRYCPTQVTTLARRFLAAILFSVLYAGLLTWIDMRLVRRDPLPDMSYAQFFGITLSWMTAVGAFLVFILKKDRPVIRPRIFDRLPDDKADAQVARLHVQDHYVVVYLTDGSEHRLLMRFSDAVAEMDGVDGFCIHRSHWVARDCLASVMRRSGREIAILTCGTEIPVSKTYRQNVVDAGFV